MRDLSKGMVLTGRLYGLTRRASAFAARLGAIPTTGGRVNALSYYQSQLSMPEPVFLPMEFRSGRGACQKNPRIWRCHILL
jgi:hypothetical protein